MTPQEAGRVLAACALYDNRTLAKETAYAWAQALAGFVTYEDAVQAVADHYSETREWIMPADINRRVRLIRKARIGDVTAPAPPVVLEVSEDIRWRRLYIYARGSGATDAEAHDYANRHTGIEVPQEPEIERPEFLRDVAQIAARKDES